MWGKKTVSTTIVECNKRSFVLLKELPTKNVLPSELCECVMQYAKEYVSCRGDDHVRDDILVGGINLIGKVNGCNYAFFASDLYELNEYNKNIEPNALLNIMVVYFSLYVAGDNTEAAQVLADFTTYVAKCNDFDKVFMAKELLKMTYF